jgi:hypothetical protein
MARKGCFHAWPWWLGRLRRWLGADGDGRLARATVRLGLANLVTAIASRTRARPALPRARCPDHQADPALLGGEDILEMTRLVWLATSTAPA